MTGQEVVEDAVVSLRREIRRLQPDQGRIARRNARRAVWGAMKALRNALQSQYPRVERPVTDDRFVVDMFEKTHRVGHGLGSRVYGDRWRVVRRTDFAGYSDRFLSRFSNKTGPMVPADVREATRFASWCKRHLAHRTFRLRKVGEKDGLVADVL